MTMLLLFLAKLATLKPCSNSSLEIPTAQSSPPRFPSLSFLSHQVRDHQNSAAARLRADGESFQLVTTQICSVIHSCVPHTSSTTSTARRSVLPRPTSTLKTRT